MKNDLEKYLYRFYNLIESKSGHIYPIITEQEQTSESETIHTVKQGDTLNKIARQYGVTLADIIKNNNIKNANRIFINQQIKIPKKQTGQPTSAPPDVKNFQDWLDINKPNWLNGGKLNRGRGYGVYGPITNNAWSLYANEYLSQVQNQQGQQQTDNLGGFTPCPKIESSPNFRELEETVVAFTNNGQLSREQALQNVNNFINICGSEMMTTIPTMTNTSACQFCSVSVRTKYNQKNIFIIDSTHKLIYLFGPVANNGKRPFIDRDVIIDGVSKQRNDAVSVAKAFQTYEERHERLKSKLGREPSAEEIKAEMAKEDLKFMPAGIYHGSGTGQDSGYAGQTNKDNMLYLSNWEGKETSHAIHGFYKGDDRVEMMRKAKNIVKNPNDVKQIDAFINDLKNKKIKMDWSAGCINLTDRFTKYISTYGQNSVIFNIAEDNENYLVMNPVDFINKQKASQSCQSPEALGAVDINTVA